MNEETELTLRFDIVVEYKGQKALDRQTAMVLKAVKERGSIHSAAKALGMPYSRIYDIIAKIERMTGKKIVETKRGGKGGGGATLTEFGEKLLSMYEIALSKLVEAGLANYVQYIAKENMLTIAHSHDPALSIIFSILSENGVSIRSLCTGSCKALAMLSLGLADIACVHLYDPGTGRYNKPYLEMMLLSDVVEYIGGYMREVVFVYKPKLKIASIDELIQKILSGELVIACRNRGSGTRMLLETILKTYAEKYGVDVSQVRGLDIELYTHDDVARCVRQGKADVGLALRYVAEKYNLKHIHVTWELFECYVLKTRINNAIHKFREFITSKEFMHFINSLPGYKALEM